MEINHILQTKHALPLLFYFIYTWTILQKSPKRHICTCHIILSKTRYESLRLRYHRLPWMINSNNFLVQNVGSYYINIICICGRWMVKQKKLKETVEDTHRWHLINFQWKGMIGRILEHNKYGTIRTGKILFSMLYV